MRNIYRFPKSADLLKYWRNCKYKDENDPKIPPQMYWGTGSGPSTTVDEKTGKPRINWGEGLGVSDARVSAARPFRFVGYADEVRPSIGHTGWYGDDEGSGYTMCRGVVLQIPGKGGQPRYLAGYSWGEQGAKRSFHEGGGTAEYTIYADKDDAAYAADQMAEYAAEAERDERREEEARIAEEEREAKAQAERDEEERLELADTPTNGAD